MIAENILCEIQRAYYIWWRNKQICFFSYNIFLKTISFLSTFRNRLNHFSCLNVLSVDAIWKVNRSFLFEFLDWLLTFGFSEMFYKKYFIRKLISLLLLVSRKYLTVVNTEKISKIEFCILKSANLGSTYLVFIVGEYQNNLKSIFARLTWNRSYLNSVVRENTG